MGRVCCPLLSVVSFLLCQVDKESKKIQDALKFNVPVVSEAFLEECEKLNK